MKIDIGLNSGAVLVDMEIEDNFWDTLTMGNASKKDLIIVVKDSDGRRMRVFLDLVEWIRDNQE
jgi:hypothetical protein